jgi:DNA-binding protein
MSNNNVVYVGSTPILNYCLAVIESLRHSDSVALKARGKAIRRAVDTAEVTRNRCLKGVNVKSIEIIWRSSTPMKETPGTLAPLRFC